MRLSLQSITNVKMEGAVWQQALLPSSIGGLGVRKSVDFALPVLLSSSHASPGYLNSTPWGAMRQQICGKSVSVAHYVPPVDSRGKNVHGIQALWRP